MSHKGEDKALSEYIAQVYEKVRSKTDFTKKLQTHPLIIACNPFDSAWHQGFECGVNLYAPHTDVWSVNLFTGMGSWKLHLSNTHALRAFVQEQEDQIIPKKDPPAKVIAKMLALRITRACAEAESQQNVLNNRYQNIQDSADKIREALRKKNYPGNRAADEETLARFEKELGNRKSYLLDPESTLEGLRKWSATMRQTFTGYNVFKDLVEFLTRPDVTEEMSRMALDMMLVKEIHLA
jgi:hypothetical protein